MVPQPEASERNWLLSHLGHILVTVGTLGIVTAVLVAFAARS